MKPHRELAVIRAIILGASVALVALAVASAALDGWLGLVQVLIPAAIGAAAIAVIFRASRWP